MPRENRKRGKKRKKQKSDEENIAPVRHGVEEETQNAGPSWIVERAVHGHEDRTSSDAPFGFVDPDVKAYFKTVDAKLREWQETNDWSRTDEGADDDPNEERRMFLLAALEELSGKELQLSTDPECSNVLERMAYSMDDFVKRVLMDRLRGSYERLSKHRFASHVVQTLLSVSKGTICREAKGICPLSPNDDGSGEGHLLQLIDIILYLGHELLSAITTLIMDPFASHVLRTLFILLCPSLPSAVDSSSAYIIRSKKSAKHRAKQGPLKSVFADTDDGNQEDEGNSTAARYPSSFEQMAFLFVDEVREELNANEVRALAADKVACPVLVLLLEIESRQGTGDEGGSLLDSVSHGLVSASLRSPEDKPEPSDYVVTLLREPTASHLLERVVSLVPESAFNMLWELYFQGKLAKLAVHPVANYVVARAIDRANVDQLSSVFEELKGVWPKIIKNARTGVLKALIDRAVQLKDLQGKVAQVILDTFGLQTADDQRCLVECVLYLKLHADLQTAMEKSDPGDEEDGTQAKNTQVALEPTIQGSILVQSLLHLDAPHNESTIQSILNLPIERLLGLAHHPISARILDELVMSPSVPSSARRRLILAFQGHFPALVDDRIGSRVGERLWAAADPYLKEKLAGGLIPHEYKLVGSRYGKFFMRGLNLYLLKRDPEEWKEQQSRSSTSAGNSMKVVANETEPAESREKEPKRKRTDEPKDEIDALFMSALGKRQKKGSLAVPDAEEEDNQVSPTEQVDSKDLSGDKNLESILGAIRSAPTSEKTSGKRKR